MPFVSNFPKSVLSFTSWNCSKIQQNVRLQATLVAAYLHSLQKWRYLYQTEYIPEKYTEFYCIKRRCVLLLIW